MILGQENETQKH